jgi:hypothetical protein
MAATGDSPFAQSDSGRCHLPRSQPSKGRTPSRFVAIRYRDLVMMAGHTREPGGSMDLKGLQRKAKQLIDRRGGTDSLKADAEELKDIAKGPGSVADKAKRAGEALKDPGAKGPDAPPAPHPSATRSPASPAPAAEPGPSPDA